MILLDTNVLIYATDTRSEYHEPSKRIVDAVIEGRLRGVILPQILVEFIGAVTGPTVEIPLNPSEAVAQASIFRAQIRMLHPIEF